MPCRREPIHPAVQVDLTGRETLNAIPSGMAEQNQMSSELSSIDPLALSWVEYWHPIARKGLLIGCSIAVVAAVVSVGFLLLLWRTSNVRHQLSDWRTSTLQVQARTAEADLLRAKADLSGAEARVAEAHAEATHANQTITALEVNAAKANERIATLEKEAAVSKSALSDAEAHAGVAQAEARHATETISELRADVAKSQEHIATLEKEVSAANAAVARADVRLAETRAEATRATEIVSMLEADVAKAQSRIATLEKEAATAKAALADADARVAGAKAQAARATETISMLEADAAKAQSRIATLENEIASAKAHSPNADANTAAAQGGEQERTAVLEKAATAANAERTEAETQAVDARLALEKLKERRILGLEQQARITAALIGYAGQEYTLSVASGSEPESLLCEIDAALSAAQWKRIPSPHSITVNTKCGNASLNGLSGLSVRLSEKADTEHQWNMLMLVNALRAEGIAVDGSIDGEDASPTAIAVTVGIKPY